MRDPLNPAGPAVAALLAAALPAAPAAAALSLQPVASGLDAPLYATHAPGDSRLFVVERDGVIKAIDGGAASTFLDISSEVASETGELGLLGLAFHPNFDGPAGTTGSGEFFVNYTRESTTATTPTGGSAPYETVVERFRIGSGGTPASAGQVIAFGQPQANHNGGWIGFSPVDGYLYIASGDGGNANDAGPGHVPETGNAQDTTDNLLGKMLRLDVDVEAGGYAVPESNPFTDGAGDDEIWSYGLRNPFRAGFDRLTGDLWIADVGQGAREEVNLEPAGVGGRNYGWRVREGTIERPGNLDPDLPPAERTDPIFDYAHGELGGSVIGGYVYRGSLLGDAYEGDYFFGDFVSGRIFLLEETAGGWAFTDLTEELDAASLIGAFSLGSFGEGPDGELYVIDYGGGQVFRIVPEPASVALLALGAVAALRRRR